MSTPLHAYAQNIQAQLEHIDILADACNTVTTWGLQDFVSQKVAEARVALETDAIRVDTLLEQGQTDAPYNSSWKYVIEMLTFIADPIPKDGVALIHAVQTGQTAQVEVLIKFGINLHASKNQLITRGEKQGKGRKQITHTFKVTDDDPHFAILTAASNGFVDIVRLIMGVNPGIPPKALLVGICHIDVVRCLLPFMTADVVFYGMVASIQTDSLESARILLMDSRAAKWFTTVLPHTFTRSFEMLRVYLEFMHLFHINAVREPLISQQFDAACERGLTENVFMILPHLQLKPHIDIRKGIISAIANKHDELSFKMFQLLMKDAGTKDAGTKDAGTPCE